MKDLESTVRARLHDLADGAPDGDAGENAATARTRHRRRRRNRTAVLAVCAGLVVVAGGSTAAGVLLSSSGPDGQVVTVPGEATSPAVPPPSSTPSSSTPSSSTPSSTPSSSTPVAGGPADWPAEATAVHGGTYWAVFLDVSRAGDPSGEEEAEARASLSALGYRGVSGPVDCLEGEEVLGLDPETSYTGVWVEFASAADAQTFVDLYQPGVVGTARIQVLCLD